MRLDEMVSGWMTDRPETIGPDQLVCEAYAVMCDRGIRHIPVVEAGRLIGIISDRDVARGGVLPHGNPMEARIARLFVTRVCEIMTREGLLTATPMTTLGEAARVMVESKASALPVLDGDKLVGIVTSHDLLRALSGMPRVYEEVAASVT